MLLDTYSKSVQLLELIANSIYERSTPLDSNHNFLNFTTAEVQVVQKWLREFMKETKK